MARVQNKFFAIVEVDHVKIEANAISKESAQEIAQILFFTTTRDAAVVQFNELLKDYPSDKYRIEFRGPTSVNIYDIAKVSGWVKSWRPNRHVKTISIRETPDKPAGPTPAAQ